MHFIFLHKKNWSGNLASNNKNSIQSTWRALASDRNRKRFNTNSGQLHKKVTARKVKCQTKTFNFLTWYNSVKSSRNIFWSSFQELSFFETKRKILKDDIFYGVFCVCCTLHVLCLMRSSSTSYCISWSILSVFDIIMSKWDHKNRNFEHSNDVIPIEPQAVLNYCSSLMNASSRVTVENIPSDSLHILKSLRYMM